MTPTAPADLSVAAINRKRAQSRPGPATGTPWPPAAAAVDALPATAADDAPKPKSFQLPFDPLRLVDALCRRWWWPLLVGTLAAVALVAVGRGRFETRHVASLQLLKQAPPTNIRASESGDPFKPREISIPTLISMMRSTSVLERVAAQTGAPPVDADVIRSGLTISPERNTDIIFVSYNSPESSAAAVRVLNAYADEVLRLTRQMQQQDAAEMNRFLLTQLKDADAELLKTNEALLAYAKEANLLDADKQMDAFLGELGNFNLKYEATRLDAETLDLKIKSIEDELAKVSQSGGRVKAVQDEIAQLLTKYTEEHPAVTEARERLAAVEKSVAEENTKTDGPPAAGGAIAESLYLQLVELRPQRQIFAEQMRKLLEVKAGIEQKLAQLPRKALEYATIKSRQQALTTTRGLLASRQKEAALHEGNSLGYYRLLAPAREQDATVEKPTKKLVIFGVGGLAGGAAFVAFVIVFLELLNQRVRTPADLKRATGLPLAGVVPDAPGDAAAASAWAFRTWTRLAPSLPAGPGEATTVALIGAGESVAPLAHLLANAAVNRGSHVLLVLLSPDTCEASDLSLDHALAQPGDVLARALSTESTGPLVVRTPADWTWTAARRTQLAAALATWRLTPELAVLAALPPADLPETLLLAEAMPHLLWHETGDARTAGQLKEAVQIYRDAGCNLAGAFMEKAARLRPAFLQKLFAPANA